MNLTLNWNQTASFGRHVITFAMGGITFAAALGLLDGSHATDATQAIQQISSGVSLVIAGATTLIGLASGLWATWSASPFSQLASVAKNPQVAQVVVTSPALADKLPANVVAAK
jgi:hypothetical protein